MTMFKAAALAALLAVGGAANATVYYSETFSAEGFAGAPLGGADTSDRFGATQYSYINNVNGWTFNPSNTFFAAPLGGGSGAVLLNENGGDAFAQTTITGLTAGRSYKLSLLVSGDNRPGEAYVLTTSIAGSNFTANGVDGAPGSTTGTPVSYVFTATGTSEVLRFGQASVTEASPIIDNITVSSVPEPQSWALLLVGFGLVGLAHRRRTATVAA